MIIWIFGTTPREARYETIRYYTTVIFFYESGEKNVKSYKGQFSTLFSALFSNNYFKNVTDTRS